MSQNCRRAKILNKVLANRDLIHMRRVRRWYRQIYGAESGFTRRQKTGGTMQAAGVTLFLAMFFYRSFLAVPLMIPVGMIYLTLLEKKKRTKGRERLRSEFKDAILSVAANLRAGYAVENAFRETMQEMKVLHGREAPIYRELYKITQGLANRISIETLMQQFAGRAKLEEIQEFADIFSMAKRSGGNLTEIIYETAAMISEKIDVEKEIQVLLAAKRLEQNIMSVIPFAIILYVSAASSGYFDVLYETIAGRTVMSICLAVYAAAYIMGVKITEVKI